MKRSRDGDSLVHGYDLFASIDEILQTIPTTPSTLQLRGVFISQLYSIPPHNRTDIDKAVKEERDKLTIKAIHGHHDSFVMKVSDYIDELDCLQNYDSVNESLQSEILIFIKFAINCNQLSIFKKDLSNLLISDATIAYLTEQGYLTYRRDVSNNVTDLFWFTLPNLGLLNQSIIETRNFIVSLIKRKMYKEIALEELLKYSSRDCVEKEKKTYRNMNIRTHMGLRYHVYDLIGNSIVTSVDLPTRGILLRLSHRKASEFKQ